MSKTSVERIAKEWFRRKALAWASVLEVDLSWYWEAFPEVEVKAKDPTVFCKDKCFWKGIQKTLHGTEKWEEGVYLLAEVDLQEMSSALMYS